MAYARPYACSAPSNGYYYLGVMFVENKKLEKNLIFYVPGKSGAIFTYQAGFFINDEILNKAMEALAIEVGDPIKHIEERRLKPREA
jgi:hypothetical protein